MPSAEEIMISAEKAERRLSWEEIIEVIENLYQNKKYPAPRIISSANEHNRDVLLLALGIASVGEDLYAQRLMKLVPSVNGHIPTVMTEIYFG